MQEANARGSGRKTLTKTSDGTNIERKHLETLEEISVAGRETFLAAGGERFFQIPA
jgi:hypothetical protein